MEQPCGQMVLSSQSCKGASSPLGLLASLRGSFIIGNGERCEGQGDEKGRHTGAGQLAGGRVK